jgi:hypothetical protein
MALYPKVKSFGRAVARVSGDLQARRRAGNSFRNMQPLTIGRDPESFIERQK